MLGHSYWIALTGNVQVRCVSWFHPPLRSNITCSRNLVLEDEILKYYWSTLASILSWILTGKELFNCNILSLEYLYSLSTAVFARGAEGLQTAENKHLCELNFNFSLAVESIRFLTLLRCSWKLLGDVSGFPLKCPAQLPLALINGGQYSVHLIASHPSI